LCAPRLILHQVCGVKEFAHAIRFASDGIADYKMLINLDWCMNEDLPNRDGIQWQNGLENRENRDKYFFLMLREMKEDPRLKDIRLIVDGEPCYDVKAEKVTFRSFESPKGTTDIIYAEEGTKLGEGEQMVLNRARQLIVHESYTHVVIVSADSDTWVYALMNYCLGHLGSPTMLIVDKRNNDFASRGFIDIIKAEKAIGTLDNWSTRINRRSRCLSLALIYFVTGCDWQPHIHGITSLTMFNAYFSYQQLEVAKGLVAEPLLPERITADAETNMYTQSINVSEAMKIVAFASWFGSKNGAGGLQSVKGFGEYPGEHARQAGFEGHLEGEEEVNSWINQCAAQHGYESAAKGQPAKAMMSADPMKLQVLRAQWSMQYGEQSCLHSQKRFPSPEGYGFHKSDRWDGAFDMVVRSTPNTVYVLPRGNLQKKEHHASTGKRPCCRCDVTTTANAERQRNGKLCSGCVCHKTGFECTLECGCKCLCNEDLRQELLAMLQAPSASAIIVTTPTGSLTTGEVQATASARPVEAMEDSDSDSATESDNDVEVTRKAVDVFGNEARNATEESSDSDGEQ
jgi:hypothetical protein